MSNEQDNHLNDSNLKDYETEVENSKGFFATIFDKIKKSSQKSLPSGNTNKINVTSRSINSMWGLGNLRTSLFNAFDSVRKTFSKPKEVDGQNKFNTVVIGSDDSKNKNPEQVKDIPPMIQAIFPKGILDNSVKTDQSKISDVDSTSDSSDSTSSQGGVEVSTIDASAAEKATSTLTVGTIKIADESERDDDLVVEKPEENDIDLEI